MPQEELTPESLLKALRAILTSYFATMCVFFPCEMTIILSHLPSNSPEGPFIFGHQLGDRKGHREPSRSTALPEEYWKVKVWGCQPWLTIEVEIRSKFLELILLFSYMFK